MILRLLFLCCITSTGFAAVPSLNNPNVHKISDNVYVMVGDMDVPNKKNHGFICNSAFVLTKSGVVVIDPGGSRQIGEMLIRQIRKRTKLPITHVFNTHHHADHWMGNHAFKDLKRAPIIIGHQFMFEQAQQIGERWKKIIADMTGRANVGTRVVLPDKTIKSDQTMTLGGINFQLLLPSHAHTKGDIVIYIDKYKTLFAGDVLFYKRTPGFQDASPLGNEQALIELKKLNAKFVVPGHGPVTDNSGIDYMLSFISLLKQEVTKYYKQGLSDFEMKNKLNMGKFTNMSGFESRFGITVNRMFLEVEQLDFQ